MSVAIVVPVFNQGHFTQGLLQSHDGSGERPDEIIVIDNGSTDDTPQFLAGRSDIRVITNKENFGCAAAWNQGVKAVRSEWIVVINNDVLVSPDWLRALIRFAKEQKLDIVSPAIREGEHNYDLPSYAREFTEQLGQCARLGLADGICFMVHRRVFDSIGFFDERFRIGQFEDTDFFRRAKIAGFRLGTTGASLIHHFGQVTQRAIWKQSPGNAYASENRAYYLRKWKLSWWRRYFERQARAFQIRRWRARELRLGGHSLKEKWIDGELRYF